MPVQINAATSGSTTLVPTDAVTTTLTLPSATGTLIATSTSGAVLQIVTANDVGSSTTSTTRVNLNASTVNITPKSTSSKIFIEVGFGGFIGYAGAGTNSTGTFDISEGSTMVSSAAQVLSVASGAGTNVQINAPSYLIAVVTNAALTTRGFSIYGKTSSSAAAASASNMTWKLTEVAT